MTLKVRYQHFLIAQFRMYVDLKPHHTQKIRCKIILSFIYFSVSYRSGSYDLHFLDFFPQLIKFFNPNHYFFSSGGIGRSGTFLTAYGAYSHFLQLSEPNFVAKKAEPICLVKTVKEFRSQRHPWMVEGPR